MRNVKFVLQRQLAVLHLRPEMEEAEIVVCERKVITTAVRPAIGKLSCPARIHRKRAKTNVSVDPEPMHATRILSTSNDSAHISARDAPSRMPAFRAHRPRPLRLDNNQARPESFAEILATPKDQSSELKITQAEKADRATESSEVMFEAEHSLHGGESGKNDDLLIPTRSDSIAPVMLVAAGWIVEETQDPGIVKDVELPVDSFRTSDPLRNWSLRLPAVAKSVHSSFSTDCSVTGLAFDFETLKNVDNKRCDRLTNKWTLDELPSASEEFLSQRISTQAALPDVVLQTPEGTVHPQYKMAMSQQSAAEESPKSFLKRFKRPNTSSGVTQMDRNYPRFSNSSQQEVRKVSSQCQVQRPDQKKLYRKSASNLRELVASASTSNSVHVSPIVSLPTTPQPSVSQKVHDNTRTNRAAYPPSTTKTRNQVHVRSTSRESDADTGGSGGGTGVKRVMSVMKRNTSVDSFVSAKSTTSWRRTSDENRGLFGKLRRRRDSEANRMKDEGTTNSSQQAAAAAKLIVDRRSKDTLSSMAASHTGTPKYYDVDSGWPTSDVTAHSLPALPDKRTWPLSPSPPARTSSPHSASTPMENCVQSHQQQQQYKKASFFNLFSHFRNHSGSHRD